MADSEKSRAQEPELRRDAGKPAPEGADSFSTPEIFDEDDQRRAAIYLIEREAIELRRQRWVDLYYSEEGAPEVERAPDGTWRPVMPSSERQPADLARMAKYDRPPSDRDQAAQSRMGRIGSWLKSIFIGG